MSVSTSFSAYGQVTVKIVGLDELQRKLQGMPIEVAKRVVRSSLRDAAAIVQQRMAILAPKKTGLLSRDFNVTVGFGKDGELSGVARVGPKSGVYYPFKGDVKKAGVATGKHPKKGGAVPVISVARFQEFGTSKMAAHPFMRPAFEQTKDEVLEKIIAEIKAALAVRVY